MRDYIANELIPTVGGFLIVVAIPLIFLFIWGDSDFWFKVLSTDILLILLLFLAEKLLKRDL